MTFNSFVIPGYVQDVIPLRGMTAAVFLCMSKLLRSKTLHVIPGLTRNLIDEKLPRRNAVGAFFYCVKLTFVLIFL